MFYLYHSNDLELLKGLMLEQIKREPASLFEKEHILVQSQGMAHWLKLQLAQGLGVAAQVDFPLPSSFIWQVFNKLKPELPERSHFDKQIMAWKLMRLLPELAKQKTKQPEYEAITQYLELENDEFKPLKCYQLAQNIADVFDQYLIYRPHWLLDWEAGSNLLDGKEMTAHAWQPLVWRALVEDSRELGHSLEHRAHVQLQLADLVANNSQAFEQLPKRLFVFGIATLPKVYLQVLQAISSKVDIHFFLLNPCNEFWGDIVNNRQLLKQLKQRDNQSIELEVGNPLLASWGRIGREFLQEIQSSDWPIQEFELFYQDDERQQNLLSYVQQDILQLNNRQAAAYSAEALNNSQFKQSINEQDGSIRLVSAHSPLREVQRLYDQILYWLDTTPNLKPRDIVVMVPDINQYAPYIDAVFSSHKTSTTAGNDYRIPWAIADQAIAQENPIIDSFLNLLNLPESRFLTTEVQDWLEVAAIANRFEISQDELEQIRDWLAQAEIRWGLDGGQREQLGLPKFEQNSWRQGLRQLLLGAMLPSSAASYQQDVPVFALEGGDTELLGKLLHFIDTLESYRLRLQQSGLIIEDWLALLNDLINDFYQPDDHELPSVQSIRQAIEQWLEDISTAHYQQSLPVEVLAAWFNDHLGQQTGWQRFLSGPVNFCSLMPMRSIPFKAVCILGMNDIDYPRRTVPVGFDLIRKYPQAGDRSRREDDRYLFLEAVCSAQDYLYISYRGRDIRENTEQRPSVLVAELRDYLADGFCLENDKSLPHQVSQKNFLAWLQEELPLQPYNPTSFKPEHPRAIASFQQLWAQVANADETTAASNQDNWLKRPLPLPAELSQESVQLSNIIQALKHPAKFFVQRRLHASLDTDWQEQGINEPFGTDNLVKHKLKEEWLERVQAEPERLLNIQADMQQFSQEQQALGRLPVNELGKHWGEEVAITVQPLAEELQTLLANPIENAALSVQVGSTVIEGELQQAYLDEAGQGCLVIYRVGKVRGEHLLDAWLRLLLANLATQANEQPINKAIVLGIDNKEGLIRFELATPDAAIAEQQLEQALVWYWQCWQQPIPHYPNMLWNLLNEFAAAAEKSDSEEQLQDKKDELIDKELENEYGELNDLYSQRCLAGFIQKLPANYEKWLAEYSWIMLAIQQTLGGKGND